MMENYFSVGNVVAVSQGDLEASSLQAMEQLKGREGLRGSRCVVFPKGGLILTLLSGTVCCLFPQGDGLILTLLLGTVY